MFSASETCLHRRRLEHRTSYSELCCRHTQRAFTIMAHDVRCLLLRTLLSDSLMDVQLHACTCGAALLTTCLLHRNHTVISLLFVSTTSRYTKNNKHELMTIAIV